MVIHLRNETVWNRPQSLNSALLSTPPKGIGLLLPTTSFLRSIASALHTAEGYWTFSMHCEGWDHRRCTGPILAVHRISPSRRSKAYKGWNLRRCGARRSEAYRKWDLRRCGGNAPAFQRSPVPFGACTLRLFFVRRALHRSLHLRCKERCKRSGLDQRCSEAVGTVPLFKEMKWCGAKDGTCYASP